MTAFLFIGNLNYDTTNDELSELLSEYGSILNCKIILDKFTLKSKGFAHIDVENRETADKIIRELNGTEFNRRPLKIEYLSDNQ